MMYLWMADRHPSSSFRDILPKCNVGEAKIGADDTVLQTVAPSYNTGADVASRNFSIFLSV